MRKKDRPRIIGKSAASTSWRSSFPDDSRDDSCANCVTISGCVMSSCACNREAFGLRLELRRWVAIVLGFTTICAGASGADRGRKASRMEPRDIAEGRFLFGKVWEHQDPGANGGDGLGPLFNEKSCAGCHHQGGVGGGGDNTKNVLILTTSATTPRHFDPKSLFTGELEELHPGFKNRSSIVLHRFAISAVDVERLRVIQTYTTVQTRDETFALKRTERSTPSLFGSGLIDTVPNSALLEIERQQASQKRFPEIGGRVSRLRDGRIGRFGWKAQVATLEDFVLAACSNELGLESPGLHQPTLESAKEFNPAKMKLDLDGTSLKDLTRFVQNLPRPTARATSTVWPLRGEAVFDAIGCSVCHLPQLHNVKGIYSDLLLHDLGEQFNDLGSAYGGFAAPAPSRVVDNSSDKNTGSKTKSGEAEPTEWRTPPLWGAADSAPYLHDGRASTFDQAIRFHRGEAAETTTRYERLTLNDRQALLAFLHVLKAPPQPKPRDGADAKQLAGSKK